MKKQLKIRLFTSILAICTLALSLPGLARGAESGDIYINDGKTVLDISLDDAYVIGGSGRAGGIADGQPYAMTADGLEQVGVEGGGGGVITDVTVIPAPYEGTVTLKSDIVKVGLKYYFSEKRDSSVPSSTLSQIEGEGFEFGFFDSNREFTPVGYTDETRLTMLKDTNLLIDGAGSVYCYHILLDYTYNSFEDARDDADYFGGFPAYYDGVYRVLVGQYSSADAAQEALDRSGLDGIAFSASNRCVVVTIAGTSEIIFEFDCGSSASLALRPIADYGEELTKHGDDSFRGSFEFIRTQGNNLTVVNYVEMEDYVKGVIPYEMGNEWPLEALKAQACCARTYAAKNYKGYGEYGFDVTCDTYSQVYRGTTLANDLTDSAVEETYNEYVTYNGTLCSTLYFSSDGGSTENSENVFADAYPYLKGRLDPFEQSIPKFLFKSWGGTFTPWQLGARLTENGYPMGEIVSVLPEYTDAGNMARIVYRDSSGRQLEVTRSKCYTSLGFQSIHFTIEKNSSGSYVISGGGWGHNVGLSQWGAYSMAYYHDYNYADILGFYYTGVSISQGR